MIKHSEKKEGYLINRSTNKYTVCKIIKEFNTEEEAIQELVKLLTKKDKIHRP